LKFNISSIFQSFKFRILIKKVLPISLKLNFIPNTSGCYRLKMTSLIEVINTTVLLQRELSTIVPGQAMQFTVNLFLHFTESRVGAPCERRCVLVSIVNVGSLSLSELGRRTPYDSALCWSSLRFVRKEGMFKRYSSSCRHLDSGFICIRRSLDQYHFTPNRIPLNPFVRLSETPFHFVLPC